MKKTLQFLIIIATVLVSKGALAQKCDYRINEIDKFTKEKKIVTASVVVGKNMKISKGSRMKTAKWYLKEENKMKYLVTNYHFTRSSIIMNGSEEIILLLSNGEAVRLKLKALMPLIDNTKLNGFEMEYEYILTQEELSKLIENDIKDVRVEAQINGFDFSMPEDVSTKLLFRCI